MLGHAVTSAKSHYVIQAVPQTAWAPTRSSPKLGVGHVEVGGQMLSMYLYPSKQELHKSLAL